MSCGSCDGRCCAVFTFPRPPEDIRRLVESGKGYVDGEFIADMLVPLTREEALERMERFDVQPIVDGVEQTREEWTENCEDRSYTCRHWDEDTRLCMAYDERPQMCRDYPYTDSCQHGCGWELPAPDLKVYVAKMEAYKERRARDSNPEAVS